MASLIIVLFGIERLFALYVPLKISEIFTTSKVIGIIIISGPVIFISYLYMYIWISLEVQKPPYPTFGADSEGQLCIFTTQAATVVYKFIGALRGLIPFFSILIVNILTFTKLAAIIEGKDSYYIKA